ncbi:hypothetical protein EMIT079MI2_340032 [Bacillus sp. IT-79MI2]
MTIFLYRCQPFILKRIYSIIPINKAKGWEYLGENGHTIEFQKGNRKIIILHLPEDRNYYLLEYFKSVF